MLFKNIIPIDIYEQMGWENYGEKPTQISLFSRVLFLKNLSKCHSKKIPFPT
jgi:hypothetical protein